MPLIAALALAGCSSSVRRRPCCSGGSSSARRTSPTAPPRDNDSTSTGRATRPLGRRWWSSFYGGRWQGGSKDQYRLLGDALTREGFVAVVPDYRLAPAVEFPRWVEDAARAVRWVRDSIARYGGDPDRLVLAGHSAGAHTVVLLALDPRWLRAAGVPPGRCAASRPSRARSTPTWTDPDVQALMGPRSGWPATYPRTYLRGDAPPLLLLHGARDRTVAPVNSTRLAAKVRAAGGCARARSMPGSATWGSWWRSRFRDS